MAENTDKTVSTQQPGPEKKEQEPPKAKSPIPQIENYIHPITIETLNTIEQFNELTLKNYTKKLEQTKGSNLIIKHKSIELKEKDISSLFKEKESISEINDNEIYEFIFDCVNFYHFIKDNSEKVEKKNLIKFKNRKYLKELGE